MTMLLRFLNPQGIAGIAVSIALAILFVIQKGETRHWKKQSGDYEQLYSEEQAALAGTVANYRAAAQQASVADAANAQRVVSEQSAINERTEHDYEIRLAHARAAAERLRRFAQTAAHSGGGGATTVPGLPAPSSGPAKTAGQDQLLPEDALTATEQAIQLDELIKWVRAQAKVDNNNGAVTSPPRD